MKYYLSICFSITAHWVDAQFIRHDFPLAVDHFELEQQKTAVNIVGMITEKLKVFGLNMEQLVCVVRDGEATMACVGKKVGSRFVTFKNFNLVLI